MRRKKRVAAVSLAASLVMGNLFCRCFTDVFGEAGKALAMEPGSQYEIELADAELTIGNTQRIKLPQEVPEDAVITYSSSNEAIAYVRDGVIVAEKLGEARIIVTAQKGTECWEGTLDVLVRGTVYQLKTYQNHFYLLENYPAIMSLEQTNVAVGKTAVIQASVGRGTFHAVRYSIADTSIAEIETKGIFCHVTGKQQGQTVLTATFRLGNKTRRQVITVNVTEAQIPIENPQDGSEYSTESEWQGDYVYFGHYEQDNNYANGTEPILWRVLEVAEDSVLLFSDVCLEQRYYHDIYAAVTWQDSTLREWLNNDFMENAFTGAEKKVIQESVVKTLVDADFGIAEEIVTEDYVYILSMEEATNPKYGFYSEWDSTAASRQAVVTEYAIANNGYRNANNGACWWLRDNGISLKHGAYVFVSGRITETFFSGRRNDGIRPVIRLDLSEISFAETDNGYFYIVP